MSVNILKKWEGIHPMSLEEKSLNNMLKSLFLLMTEWSLFISKAKDFNITVIQVYAPNSNAEETEAEWFYEDLKDLLELTSKKDVFFIIGNGIQK